jgi:hypothetical protein
MHNFRSDRSDIISERAVLRSWFFSSLRSTHPALPMYTSRSGYCCCRRCPRARPSPCWRTGLWSAAWRSSYAYTKSTRTAAAAPDTRSPATSYSWWPCVPISGVRFTRKRPLGIERRESSSAKCSGYSTHAMRSTVHATRRPTRMFPLASFSLPLVLWCVSHPPNTVHVGPLPIISRWKIDRRWKVGIENLYYLLS